MNSFTKNAIKATNVSVTENGALSYQTMGTALLDQFGKAGTARGRDKDVVWKEQEALWVENPEMALRFPFYLRMITRKSYGFDDYQTEKVQRGQGARDESFKRLLWIAEFHPESFYKNLWILPLVGSWKDLWVLMSMSDRLDRTKFYDIIKEGINDDRFRDLVKKYLPRIRSAKACTTDWAKKTNDYAKEFARLAGWTYEDYRKFKSTGKAHEFQQYICKGLYSQIKWNTIPGKALLNLVSGDFLTKHNVEKEYIDWLDKQPVAKFNGYPFELGNAASNANTLAKKMTIDKQFDNLIKTGKEDNGALKGNILCALDTSGSMTAPINGANGVTSFDVCVSLGIYFSELNTGSFHNVVAMFDSTSRVEELKGTFTEKWAQLYNELAMGGTNFQSLINLICELRETKPEIPLEDFPSTLLIVSDMQFNPTGAPFYHSYDFTEVEEKTNYKVAMDKLREHFPDSFVDSFKIVWWYCAGRPTNDYPSTMDDGGTYMFSGFDGSVISILLGGEEKINPETGKKEQPSMEDIVYDALNQEVLKLIQFVD